MMIPRKKEKGKTKKVMEAGLAEEVFTKVMVAVY